MQAPPVTGRRHLAKLLRSVVKVLSVSDAPDFDQPWQTRGPVSCVGSGVIVETSRGLRVLTNAHCVENYAFVEVRGYGNARKYVCEVDAIGYECDLALLSVQDASCFYGIEPIALGDLPELGDQVSVCGYPVGGDRLSVTNGVVSRVEIVRYAHRQRRLLAVQIDAAINAGNSGGPVLKDGEVVGIAFQALEDADQIGYMISVPVIRHFLDDVENGAYDGFPSLGIATQPLESAAMRQKLKIPAHRPGGVFIYHVGYGSSCWGTLRAGDVLLEVDGVEIAADGTVPFRSGEMLTFDYTIKRHHVGETVEVKVWRDASELSCVVRLKPPQYLIPEERYDAPPTYFILGGLLLAPVTRDYLKTWDDWWHTAPRQLVCLYERGIRTEDQHEVVVLQKVLAHEVNQGYHHLEDVIIRRAQGQKVRSMRHLIALLGQTDDRFIELESVEGLRIILDRERALAATPEILRRFRVPADRSADLRPEAPLLVAVNDTPAGQVVG